MTRLYGVIGDPIAHSLSPLIHNQWMRDNDIDAVYKAMQVPEGELKDALETLTRQGARGLNITLPHKQTAIVLADEVGDLARRIGAANTLIRTESGGWLAENTDAPGFIHTINTADIHVAGKTVFLLGAGGSARALAIVLTDLGANLTICNRTISRAEEIADNLPVRPEICTLDIGLERLAAAELVVNTVSLGHSGKALELPPGTGRTFYDISYGPCCRTRLENHGRAWHAGGAGRVRLRTLVWHGSRHGGRRGTLPGRSGGNDMIILGLTGSIGMGKSATAELFREENVPVYDADAAVHAMYEKGGAAVEPVEAAFPGVAVDGAIDRLRLRERVLDNAEAMKRLEAIVHPLAGAAQHDFRQAAREAGAPFVVIDIPLLYEAGGWQFCDYVVVVTASAAVQRERVLSRPNMTEKAFESILARQVPDAEKRARADFVIPTEHGFEFARDLVRAIVALMIRKDADDHA